MIDDAIFSAEPVERRQGYRSWVVKDGKRWVFWREATYRPAFPTFYPTKLEALAAKEKSDHANLIARTN